jgi:dTDP-glucose 4,6-dehydratase
MAERALMIIGGTGFFGKSFLDAHARGLLRPWKIGRIIAVARRAEALRQDYPHLVSDAVHLMNADAGKVGDLPEADYVIHAASSTDARRYAEFPKEERANILRSIDNYCAIARVRHRDAAILYTSSGAVYGQQPAGLDRIDEDFQPSAVSELVTYKQDYAEAKRLAEQRIATLGADAGMRVTVARCFAFIGLYLPRDQHFAIGNFLDQGLAGQRIRTTATRPVYRSYMHADDLVHWLMTMVAAADPACPIYNVGSDEALAMFDIAHIVAAKLGVKADIAPMQSDSVDRYIPSIRRACERLGLSLRHDLRSGLDDVIDRIRRDCA